MTQISCLSFRNESVSTYKDYKMAAVHYQEAWTVLLQHFTAWQHKPGDYYNFT